MATARRAKKTAAKKPAKKSTAIKAAVVPATPTPPALTGQLLQAQPATAAQIQAIQQAMQQNVPQPVQAPYFSAGSLAIQGTGNDFLLTFLRPTPVQHGTAGINPNVAINLAAATVVVSPQTAKDLALVLAIAVKKHEKLYGVIKTPFTQKKKAPRARRQKGR